MNRMRNLDPIGHADEVLAAQHQREANDGHNPGQPEARRAELDVDAQQRQHHQDPHDARAS